MAIRFTQKAQNVLNRSLSYAGELGHTYIGSEHLLLALTAEADSVASKLLTARGMTVEKLKSAIEAGGYRVTAIQSEEYEKKKFFLFGRK